MGSRRTFADALPNERRDARQGQSRPIVADLEAWLRAHAGAHQQEEQARRGDPLCALARWEGLSRFLDDGRIEIDSNTVERSIRPLALNRKNALFAGSDGGGDNWAVIATLIENCKLSRVEPHAYPVDVLTKIVNGHPNSAIDELLPSTYAIAKPPKAVA